MGAPTRHRGRSRYPTRSRNAGMAAASKAEAIIPWSEYVSSLAPYAWWPLGDPDYYAEGSNVVSDASGNARTALYAGDQTVPARWAGSLTSEPGYGVDAGDYTPWQLRSSVLTGLTSGSFTFGFWLTGTTTAGEAYAIRGGNYFGVGLNYDWPGGGASPGAISWLASTGGADADGLNADVGWNDGLPHLVLFEYDSVADTVSIWFDGVEVATRSHAGITMPTTHTNATMLKTAGVTQDWQLDEYLFFDRVLTEEEHLALASYVGPATSPYGASWSPPYNTASHLEIPVPGLANTEAVHPDVVDMGAAWNGYRYWLAFTPYNGDTSTEEPCVVATNDIATDAWAVPAGFTNPIAADPGGADHYADTDLLYDPTSDRLYVFAIRDDGATFQDVRSWWTSGDGTWSTETTVLAGAAGTYANPSILPIPGGWRLYYNVGNSGANQLRYRESTTAPDSGYGAETICTGLGFVHFQNLNVVRDTDGSIVAVCSDALSAGGEGGRLFFARSADGVAFELTGEPVLEPSAAGWDQSGIYRASVLVDTDGVVVVDAGELDVWYSGFITGSPAQWGTAHIRVPRDVLVGVV